MHLSDAAYGAGKPGLNLDNIREMLVALPPLDEQREIVRRVDALFALARAIERRVAVATARAERLQQAVLARAFRGELVPTEAELARREARGYEDAEALLARVRAARDAGGEARPMRGRPGRWERQMSFGV
jgi:type I restriction enzyme S subunit